MIDKIICTVIFIGYLPRMQALTGSVIGFVTFYLVPFSIIQKLFLFIIILISSFYSIKRYIYRSDKNDPREIVIDEFIGASLIAIVFSSNGLTGILTLLTFRVFDIIKIWPINVVDKLEESIGIILDDILASIMAICVVKTSLLIYFV